MTHRFTNLIEHSASCRIDITDESKYVIIKLVSHTVGNFDNVVFNYVRQSGDDGNNELISSVSTNFPVVVDLRDYSHNEKSYNAIKDAFLVSYGIREENYDFVIEVEVV